MDGCNLGIFTSPVPARPGPARPAALFAVFRRRGSSSPGCSTDSPTLASESSGTHELEPPAVIGSHGDSDSEPCKDSDTYRGRVRSLASTLGPSRR